MCVDAATELRVAIAAAAPFSKWLSSEVSARAETSEAVTSEIRALGGDQWWQSADAHAIGQAYALALAWEEYLPAAADAIEMIRTELAIRHGISVSEIAEDPQLVQNQFERYAIQQIRRRKNIGRSLPVLVRQ